MVDYKPSRNPTKEKRALLDGYQSDKKPKRIIEGRGIITKILGASRINGIKGYILRAVQAGKGFPEITSDAVAAQTGRPLIPDAKIRRLEHELAYTKQELEFVKEILPLAGRKEDDLYRHLFG